MYVRRGVLRDICILKIEAKTINMYVRRGAQRVIKKWGRGGPRKKYVCKEGGVKKFPVIPPYSFFLNSPKQILLLYNKWK